MVLFVLNKQRNDRNHKSYQGEVVFHRAFDCVEDPYTSIELLIELGVDRILTSGLKPKAMDGKDLIKNLQKNMEVKLKFLQEVA